MQPRLRYIICFMAVGWLSSSCVSDDPSKTDDLTGSKVMFETAALSRSSVTTDLGYEGSEFAIFGDKKPDDVTNPVVLFNGTKISYSSSGWLYATPQYWHKNYEHSFVAVHPYSAISDGSYVDSRLTFDFSMDLGNQSTPDLLIASHRRFYDGSSALPVILRFGHALTLINLAPAMDDNVLSTEDYIEFHKLELSGFKTEGTINVVPASRQSNTQTDDYVLEISDQSKDGSLTYEFESPVKVKNQGGYVPLFAAKDAVIVLPQDFAQTSDAKIVLSYSVNGGPETETVTLPLYGQKWISGKSYSYKFTVTRTGVRFDTTTITDWDKLDVGNIDVH